MSSFEKFGLRKQLHNAIEDLGFKTPTSIQEQSFYVILSGKDMLGIVNKSYS
jgi:ATP-dependent RNA helicase RhlE